MIGSGGTFRSCRTTGAKIDIDDDGTIMIAAVRRRLEAAIDWIRGIVAEPEANAIYNGKAVRSLISAP
jgi:polyribonucleotide nucleotidyltransferase